MGTYFIDITNILGQYIRGQKTLLKVMETLDECVKT